MAAGGEHEAADIARLARGLVAAYERSGRAYNMSQGGKARDWKLRAVMADDSFFSNASDWSFGGPGGGGGGWGRGHTLLQMRGGSCMMERLHVSCMMERLHVSELLGAGEWGGHPPLLRRG